METTALAQSSNSIGESMVQVMEEHLVEAMATTQQACHDLRQHWVAAVGVQGQELVPPVRVVEVGEEGPSNGEASSASHRHGDEESPALRQRPSKRPCAQQPYAGSCWAPIFPRSPCCTCHQQPDLGSWNTTAWQRELQYHWHRSNATLAPRALSTIHTTCQSTPVRRRAILLGPTQTLREPTGPLCWHGASGALAQPPPKAMRIDQPSSE